MPKKESPRDQLEASTRQEWRVWLEKNHASSRGVWLVLYKKNSRKKSVTYEEAVEEALSFGWIDGRTNAMDLERYKLLFVPRQPGSTWAQSNKIRVEKLIREGSMAPAGLAKVEQAKKDGSWNLIDDIEALRVPPDLKKALESQPRAAANFAEYSTSARKTVLWWLFGAKRAVTREQRIKRVVAASLNGEKITDLFQRERRPPEHGGPRGLNQV
jgi:uncharacterized protein YdeI (YjbR/CyaY-like superfamily)